MSTATDLFYKISDAKQALAVFIMAGQPKTTKLGSALFKELMEKNSPKLMGVYDGGIRFDWLVEDLIWMGVEVDK